MDTNISLPVAKRTTSGKGENRRMREQGLVPAVFYNAKGENQMIAVEAKKLGKTYEKVGSTQVFDLEIEGDGKAKALIWQLHRHPYRNEVLHVDFYGVDMDKPLRIEVPVKTTGVAFGIKTQGGRLENYRDVLEVEALPGDIPKTITLDITELRAGESIHVADIELPENVKISYDENFAVLGIASKGAKAVSEEDEEGAAAD